MKILALAGIVLLIAGAALYRSDEPEPEPPTPTELALEPDKPKPGGIAFAPETPQDEPEALASWKAQKAELDAYGATVKRPDRIWSPINSTRSMAAFYQLPEKVQSNMWNHVFKQQAEAMVAFAAYMEAQNQLDAKKP